MNSNERAYKCIGFVRPGEEEIVNLSSRVVELWSCLGADC
jgi:hypothetical protein